MSGFYDIDSVIQTGDMVIDGYTDPNKLGSRDTRLSISPNTTMRLERLDRLTIPYKPQHKPTT